MDRREAYGERAFRRLKEMQYNRSTEIIRTRQRNSCYCL